MHEFGRIKQAEIEQLQAKLTRLQAELDLAQTTRQLEIRQLTAQYAHIEQSLLASNDTLATDLFETQQLLGTTQTELDRTAAVLTATQKSFSLKLGLSLTWPIRQLRPSNRSR